MCWLSFEEDVGDSTFPVASQDVRIDLRLGVTAERTDRTGVVLVGHHSSDNHELAQDRF